jgi:hypothetical protein
MATAPVSVSVRLSPSWRSAAGRFARPPVGDALDTQLYGVGRDGVRLLANATPVKTGRMRAGWRSTLVPTAHAMRVTNTQFYAPYVVWGTRSQRANPALQRIINQELPRMAQVAAGKALADIALKLKG